MKDTKPAETGFDNGGSKNDSFGPLPPPAKASEAKEASGAIPKEMQKNYDHEKVNAFSKYYQALKKLDPSKRTPEARQKLKKKTFEDFEKAHNDLLTTSLALPEKSANKGRGGQVNKPSPAQGASGETDEEPIEAGAAEPVDFK